MVEAPLTSPLGVGRARSRFAAAGGLLGACIGSLWAWLYWRGDLRYALGIVFLHALGGIALAGATDVLASLGRRRVTYLGALGLGIGAVWVAPNLLYRIDTNWLDVRVSGGGLTIVALVVSGNAFLGALAGNLLDRSSTLAKVGLLVALASLAPLSSCWFSPHPTGLDVTISNRMDGVHEVAPRQSGPRVMIFGIDGGTWDVLGSLVREEKLPNLKRLMEKGQYGVLTSVAAPSGDTASPVVWTSIFTGVRPEKHGISDWFVSDSRNRVRKSVWNILNGLGEKTILVNIPGTFPPERVRGAMISGFPIPSVVRASSSRFLVSEGRIYSTESREDSVPPGTRLFLAERDGAGDPLSFSTRLQSELPLTETVETKYGRLRHPAYRLGLGNLFLELVERRGLFQTRELARYRMVIADQTNDGVENHDVVYVSSPSGEPVAVLREGEWSDWISLRVMGAELKFKLRLIGVSETRLTLYATPLFQSSSEAVIPFTYPLGLARSLSSELGQYTVEGAGWMVYQDEKMLDPLYEHVIEVADEHMAASKRLLETVRDWSLFVHIFTESDRVQHAFWQFHQPDRYPQLDPRLVSRHGNKVRSIHERIDAQIGELLRFATEDTIVVVVSDHGFGPAPTLGRGAHTLDGVYIVSGKGIEASGRFPDLDPASMPRASVLDVTPTVLHLMGYPVGRDMDGQVLRLGAAEGACCPVSFVATYEGKDGGEESAKPITVDESTLEQLKSLGYVK